MNLLARELESLGYVTSAFKPADRRASIVVWSERSNEAAQLSDQCIVSLEQDWSTPVGPAELIKATAARPAIVRHCPAS